MEAAKPNQSYEDFDPVCKWRKGEARDTLEAHLPGFRREQIGVRVNHLGFIVISGERPLDGTRWKRFNKEVELATFCNVDAIHANFMRSILSVVLPEAIPQKEEEYTQISEYDEHDEKQEEVEETGHRYLEFRGWSIRELGGNHSRHEALGDHDIDAADEHHHHHHHHPEFMEHDSSWSSPETTRDIAFKLMVVVIVILIMASYVTDMCKSIMAHAFHN